MHSHLRGHPSLIEAAKRIESLKPDQYELYLEKRMATKVESKDQKLDSLTRSEDVGLSIRVIRGGKVGFSFTTSLETPRIDAACRQAFDVAELMPDDPNVGFLSFSELAYPAVDRFDEKSTKVPLDTKIARAFELERMCRAEDKRVTGLRSAAIGETLYEVHLVDSNGEHLEHRSSLYTASLTCKAEGPDGDAQMGGDMRFANDFASLDVAAAAREAARTATELLGAKRAPTMQCPAVLKNSVVAELIEFLSSSFSAEQIDKGRSMLARKLGERIFSDKVTLLDDGLLEGGFATSPFDGEGVPSRKNTLVDQGFMSGALYDVYYAKKLGKEPSGVSARGIKSPPSIAFTNLYIKPGAAKFDALIGDISKGILITDLMGVHTANPVTGDFSLGASGILIEGGKLTRPVQGFAVAGNVLELFRRMQSVGSDLRFFGNVGAPSVRVSELSVGGD